jgi:DNA-directed RNA polymerase specialized sigma24 family protein
MQKHREENNRRLEVLYRESHKWLSAVSFNIAKDSEIASDLVGELYVYLGERVNPSIWWGNSFNLMYCRSFILSRFFNRIKVQKRNAPLSDTYDDIEEEYDIDYDTKLEEAYDNVVAELKAMEYTKQWASSKLYQMYAFNDDMTLEKLASEIKISKSTAFLNCKKAKKHLKETIKNPFKN